MEKKMETATTVYWGNIGIMEEKMEITTIVYWGNIGMYIPRTKSMRIVQLAWHQLVALAGSPEVLQVRNMPLQARAGAERQRPCHAGLIGIMEKKMETTSIVYWGNIGIMEKKMETTIVYWGNIGIMDKKMETTIVYWGNIGMTVSKSLSK